jgi:K+ transporter
MSCSFLQLNKENRTWRADLVHEDNQELESVARKTTPAAALAALGIVYGDLGTSPLYTLMAPSSRWHTSLSKEL